MSGITEFERGGPSAGRPSLPQNTFLFPHQGIALRTSCTVRILESSIIRNTWVHQSIPARSPKTEIMSETAHPVVTLGMNNDAPPSVTIESDSWFQVKDPKKRKRVQDRLAQRARSALIMPFAIPCIFHQRLTVSQERGLQNPDRL